MFKAGFLPVLWLCIFRQQGNASYTWAEIYKWTLRVGRILSCCASGAVPARQRRLRPLPATLCHLATLRFVACAAETPLGKQLQAAPDPGRSCCAAPRLPMFLMCRSCPVQILLCGFLFTVAMFVVTMLAKLMASYFHKQAFFDKMQETLKQVPQTSTSYR